MPRVHHVLKARKDVPNSDIKAGESYYWWKFRYGGKHVSRTPPKASQLTQSDFLSRVYDLQEQITSLTADSSLPDAVEGIIGELEELRDEQEEKRNNMPENLQDSDTGQLLQERYDAIDSAINDLQAIELDEFEADEKDEDCPDCEGTGKDEEGHDCAMCEGTGKVECDDPTNADGQTEQEYWDTKLEEVQNVSIEAP